MQKMNLAGIIDYPLSSRIMFDVADKRDPKDAFGSEVRQSNVSLLA